ncbi:MAG: transporter associated domain-containing protein, partial [Tsuneonella sp.]
AGLALSVRGVVPEQGEQIEVQGYRLTIEETTGLKITRVRLEPI